MTEQRGTPAPAPIVRIAVEAGPNVGAVVTWGQTGSYLIGRAPHAQLALLHDILASLEHCRIEIQPQGCLIRDLGSRQGTVLNGNSVTQSPLRSGDKIQVGMSRLAITISDALTPTLAPTASVLRQQGAAGQANANTGFPPLLRGGEGGFLDIPGYSITKKLGEGGMGIVYEATRRATGERVAIKTIIPAPGAAHTSIKLFRREMTLLAQLEHPRIVRFIESGEFAGQIYLAMEYVDCVNVETLVQALPRERQIEIYCGVICQVLEALDYAHGQKLVHRDVKPRNILVSRAGKQLHAKLADFGLAKNFELAGLSQMTADHEIRGTPAFMPWEQLRDSRYARPTVDIYSTAATLYFFLTGRPPGHTQPPKKSWLSITSIFGAGRSLEPAAPAWTTGADFTGIPQGLAEVIGQALSSEPKQRFAMAAEMRAALLSFAQSKCG